MAKAGRAATTGEKATTRKAPQSTPPGGVPRYASEASVSDKDFDLVSVLYHALQGAETCARYFRDAEGNQDEELTEFFEECRSEYAARAAKAKELLASRLEEESSEEEEEEEEEEEGED